MCLRHTRNDKAIQFNFPGYDELNGKTQYQSMMAKGRICNISETAKSVSLRNVELVFKKYYLHPGCQKDVNQM